MCAFNSSLEISHWVRASLVTITKRPMEDWHAYVSVIGGSFEAASIVALVICVAVYGGLRIATKPKKIAPARF